MTTTLRRRATLPVMALCLASAACRDSSSVTAPAVPADYAAFGRTVSPDASRIVSRTVVGDTVATVFLVGPDRPISTSGTMT